MLKFYYHPLSPLARRVWLTLLEKQIPFEAQEVNLLGDQLKPAFLALNPFHHVPVIEDGDVRLIESLAIADYLDAAYPQIKLTPIDPAALGQMRMVQMVVANELIPMLVAVVGANGNIAAADPQWERLVVGLRFLAEQLESQPFFGGAQLSLADIVAGSAVELLQRLGVDLSGYGALEAWLRRLGDRPAWQQTRPDDVSFERWQRFVKAMIKRR
jgi:glutathione S-transferase